MKIHCVMHASFEKPGVIEEWANKKGHQFSITHIYKNENLPANVEEFDFLIFMGGPQSPLALDKYPYIADEIALAKKAIQAKKLVFGICLGAQIIAEALGAKTQRSPHREIGIYPVLLLEEGKNDPFFSKLSPTFDATHWHNDMPGIVQDMVLLAKSEGCPQQAFRYGDRVYGFQFHLELTQDLIKGMVKHCPTDLEPRLYVRSADELQNANYDPINQQMVLFLEYMESIFLNKA